jgi:hypothetical protein
MTNYFLNLLRPNAERPTKPVPISKSVAGSGTVEGPGSEDPPGGGEAVTGVDLKLCGATVLASSPGQPTIPKNIITTHKNNKNLFILFFLYKIY